MDDFLHALQDGFPTRPATTDKNAFPLQIPRTCNTLGQASWADQDRFLTFVRGKGGKSYLQGCESLPSARSGPLQLRLVHPQHR